MPHREWQVALSADLARAGGRRSLARDRSTWAIVVYRWGTAVLSTPEDGNIGKILRRLYWSAQRTVEMLTGVEIPAKARIGPGLRIHHAGPVIIHPETHIGANCTLRHGVTLGERRKGGGAPSLGDDVEVGAYAQILGDVKIGDRCKIGALALVQQDFPSDSLVVAPRAVSIAKTEF